MAYSYTYVDIVGVFFFPNFYLLRLIKSLCIFLPVFSGLNFQDLMARQGAIESLPKAPFILGFECSGVIEQVGEGVEKFKVSKK